MRSPLFLVLASSLVPGLRAQGTVSPAHFTATEGSFLANAGLGVGYPTARFLQVHDDLRGQPRIVNGLSFRRDNLYSGGNGSGGNRPAFSIVADVTCSSAANAASAMSATFAANHGPDRVQVATLRQFDFPAAPHFVMPGPWSYVLPFSQSFAYAGATGLCWEVAVRGRTNTTGINFDGASGASSSPGPWSWGFGGGCKATGEFEPVQLTTAGSTIQWGPNTGRFSFFGWRLPRNTNVLLGLSAAPLSTPFVLPGTANAPSGECSVAIDWALSVALPTTAAGTCEQIYANVPVANGMSVFSQMLALDAAANQWGVVLSNGMQTHVLAPFPAPQFGIVQATDLGPTGLASSYPLSFGYVVRFH